MSGRVLRIKRILRDNVRRHPETLFLFGDNLERRGFGGQARELRGEPNALGIPTKRSPTTDQSAYFSDADFDLVRPILDEAFNAAREAIRRGRDVVVPVDGIGTGLADLPHRAPLIYAYLDENLRALTTESLTLRPTV